MFNALRFAGWCGFALGIVGALSGLGAQEVLRVTWPTRHAAPAASASPEVAPYLPLLRASLDRMPESAVVKLALSRAGLLGVASGESERLGELVGRRYALIAADPVFKSVPSTLPYCFAESRQRQGLALVYRPRVLHERTPVLLFVHGYGGSFLWHLHQLAEWFPDHVIVCPSYGVDPSDISAAYLAECIRETTTTLGRALGRPALVGFTAGGFGVVRVYATDPAPYRQLVVLAAYPPDESFRAWPRSAHAGWIVGAREDYVADGGFATYAKSLAARSARFDSKVVVGAGAFFPLTHPEETRKTLRSWLSAPAR